MAAYSRKKVSATRKTLAKKKKSRGLKKPRPRAVRKKLVRKPGPKGVQKRKPAGLRRKAVKKPVRRVIAKKPARRVIAKKPARRVSIKKSARRVSVKKRVSKKTKAVLKLEKALAREKAALARERAALAREKATRLREQAKSKRLETRRKRERMKRLEEKRKRLELEKAEKARLYREREKFPHMPEAQKEYVRKRMPRYRKRFEELLEKAKRHKQVPVPKDLDRSFQIDSAKNSGRRTSAMIDLRVSEGNVEQILYVLSQAIMRLRRATRKAPLGLWLCEFTLANIGEKRVGYRVKLLSDVEEEKDDVDAKRFKSESVLSTGIYGTSEGIMTKARLLIEGLADDSSVIVHIYFVTVKTFVRKRGESMPTHKGSGSGP